MNRVLSQSLTQIIHIRARAHRLPMLALLDASSHLYKRVCPSVCPSVRYAISFSAEIELFMSWESQLEILRESKKTHHFSNVFLSILQLPKFKSFISLRQLFENTFCRKKLHHSNSIRLVGVHVLMKGCQIQLCKKGKNKSYFLLFLI